MLLKDSFRAMIRLRYPKPAIFRASGVHPIFGNARVGLFTLVKYLSIDLVYHRLIHDQHLSAPKRKYRRFRMVNSSLINENTLGLSSGATGQIQIGGRPVEPLFDMERTLARRFSVTSGSELPQTSSTSAQELDVFDETFEEIVNALTKEVKEPELKKVFDRFAEMLRYNVPHGKKNRGLTVVDSYRLLQPEATQHQLYRARVLGWCVEMLQAYYLIIDDIMDHSITRRGLPCWYRKEGVGNVAINDSCFIRACVYRLLGLHFREEKYYIHLLDTFHEVDLQTVVGQGLDLLTAPEDVHVDLSAFTIRCYDTIVTWKTAFYSFYLPVALAMHMAGINDAESHEDSKTILLKMGHFFQVQDDYLDCYGDPNKTGKIGTDIEDNKCSWLITRALMTANERQRRVLRENYGSCDKEKVALVKQIYTELNLKEQYQEFERESFLELTELIERSSGTLPKTIYTKLAKKIYRREK